MLNIKPKNIFKSLMIGLGILLVIIAFYLVSAKVASQDKNSIKEKNYNIEYTITKNVGETVFDALKEMAEENKIDLKYNYKYAEFGVFVESIDGAKNGDSGKYWQYYVNDKLGEVAADKKEVKAGDKVDWRFEKVPEF